jgi:hypothetical protein
MTSRTIVAALGALLLAACSSNSNSQPVAPTETGTTDEPKIPDASCVRPGDQGNDKGVGAPCTPFGKECQGFAGAPVCLADLGQDQWMCSRISCDRDEDCGEGATCYSEGRGSGCVPNRCLGPRDAGADAPSEGAVDASDEAAIDAPGAD